MKRNILITLAIIILIIDCALFTYKIYNKKSLSLKENTSITTKEPKYSVYLTSDDGPLVGSKYLDQIIRDYQVPFTIFLVGRPLSSDSNLEPNFIRYKNNPYVLLANHSFSHANFHYKRFYKNPFNVEQDFIKNENFLHLTSKIGRLPGRNVYSINSVAKGEPNALKAARLLTKNEDYKLFGWDYELSHKRGRVVEDNATIHYLKIKKLLKDKKTFRENQLIILMHDQMFTSPITQKTLGELILLLQDDKEIELKTLDKYKI